MVFHSFIVDWLYRLIGMVMVFIRRTLFGCTAISCWAHAGAFPERGHRNNRTD
jgi:hypothetical protein